MANKVRIGLDIGIGSIGWAVITGGPKNSKLENFGVRIFDSGELDNGKNRKSQERRHFRGARRLIRRRYFRKEWLKSHLSYIGFLDESVMQEYELIKDQNVHYLKAKGVFEKLTKAELYKCMIHTCNHRGYRDFYENDYTLDSDDETSVNRVAANEFESMFRKSGCRTVSQFISQNFVNEAGQIEFRNRNSRKENYLLIRRSLLQDELRIILNKQAEYHSCLTKNNIDIIDKIIFSQRNFEDGPGDKNDEFRRYTGFLKSLGSCPFYPEDKRGFRGTVIADVFAVINILSQYRFIDKNTEKYYLKPDVAKQLVDHLLKNANLTITDVKRILKANNFELQKSNNSDDKALAKAIRFLKIAKASIEKAGEDWEIWISEEQFDCEKPSKLHKIGEVLSKYQTPSYRKNELEKLGFMSPAVIKEFSSKKISGTARAGYRYMCDAIHAFLRGDIYGNFQANRMKQLSQEKANESKRSIKLLPQHIDDEDIKQNPVVFRAINETRKVLNAIIELYGSPETIVVEVASELNSSFVERERIAKLQKENEIKNDKAKQKIAELLNISVEEVTVVMLERYKLYEEQEGKCLYSSKPLGELTDVLKNTDKKYEIDHIIPFSLILDNTLNNKALVFSVENQAKGQRTPLMYLDAEKAAAFKARANEMRTRKENHISERKYRYLMLDNIYGKEAEELLSQWKSRNINDTRAITKYIVSLLSKNLVFSGNSGQPVYGVKGALTSKFRKLWLNPKTWGNPDKNRDSYLNHAVDAVVVANLTLPYIEIASDNFKLQQIYKKYRSQSVPEYQNYLEKCLDKMQKYYNFPREYSKNLLTKTERVPSYLPNIAEEVDIRFNDEDEELFQKNINYYYKDLSSFVVKPHMPITSHKQEKKFRGQIADSNPIRVVEIDSEPYKILRKEIGSLTKKDIDRLYTGDKTLISTLERIFEGKDDKYTVEKYLKENGLTEFRTDSRQPVHKVSIISGKISNFFKKPISENNYSILGGLNYYCVEVYKDHKGNTRIWGIRYVDIKHKGKKLYIIKERLPEDYCSHVMYLFPNDYIRIYKDGKIKFEGYYKSVYNINQASLYYSKRNSPTEPRKCITISKKDEIKKYHIDILGRLGGEIKCSAPLSLISEKDLV